MNVLESKEVEKVHNVFEKEYFNKRTEIYMIKLIYDKKQVGVADASLTRAIIRSKVQEGELQK